VVWGEGLGWYAGGTVFYTTQAPQSSDSNDDNDNSLSHTTVVIMSVVFSFTVGVAISGLATWLWIIRRGKDGLLEKRETA
jgi:hypothetical protein